MSQPPPIYVTQPYLPPLDEFIPYLREIWDKKILTNAGPFHARFEKALCEYLEVEHVALFANGTIGLVTALQALRVTGEVITTPYSFVATAHSLLWNGNKPVFVDIEPHSLTLDAAKIEAAITSETTAILAVHCYGHPCDVDAIQKIADNYNLRVIYDAAHAFGVRHGSDSLLTHGDLSVLSFHATKVFNTFEGGAIVCPTAKIKLRIDQLKNFGFVDETTVVAAGINGKMAEVNAALGLLQLKHIHHALARREAIDARYRGALRGVAGIRCIDAGPPGVFLRVGHGLSGPLGEAGEHADVAAAGVIRPRHEALLCGLLGDAHAAADVGPRRSCPSGLVDRVPVEVETDEGRRREGFGQFDGAAAVAATDVANDHSFFESQLLGHVLELRPLRELAIHHQIEHALLAVHEQFHP